MTRSMFRLLSFLITLVATALMTSSTQAMLAFDQIVVFGDSRSDNGNAGRASNGPV